MMAGSQSGWDDQSTHAESSNAGDDSRAEDGRCAQVEALIPAYSVGATDPDEAAMIQASLAQCPSAVTQMAKYAQLTERLLYTAPLQQAPARLESRLLAAITQDAERQSIQPTQQPSSFAAQRLGTTGASRWSRFKPTFGLNFGAILQLTTTAAAFGLLVFNVYLLRDNLQLRNTQAKLIAEQGRQKSAIILLSADDKQEIVLPAAQENSLARADVLWNTELGIAIVYVRAFPTLPPDKVYQLWLVKNDQRSSGGLFSVDEKGAGVLVLPLSAPLESYDRMGITPEPAGGSPGPTGKAVVRGPVKIEGG